MKSESEFIENADNSSSKYQLFDISHKIDPDIFNDSLHLLRPGYAIQS